MWVVPGAAARAPLGGMVTYYRTDEKRNGQPNRQTQEARKERSMPVFDWLLVARDSHFTASWPPSVSIACMTCVHTPTDTTACRPGQWEDRGPQQLAYA